MNYKEIDYVNFKNIYLISVFAILNKFTLVFSLLIPIYYFFKNKILISKIFFSIPTLFLFLWIIRNLITSGCMIYPIVQTCFTDLKWSNQKEIIYQSQSGEAWAKDWPNRNNKNLSMKEYNKNFNWIYTWKNNHLKKINKILIPYLIILFLISLFFIIKKNNSDYFKLNISNLKLPLFVSLIGTLFFFLKFPIYRYGYSYAISSIVLLSIIFIKSYNLEKINKLCIFVIIVFFGSFVYKQTDRLIEYYGKRNIIPKIYNDQKQHKTIFLDNENFYNLSLNGSCMYDVNLCTIFNNDKLIIKNKLFYKFFETVEK